MNAYLTASLCVLGLTLGCTPKEPPPPDIEPLQKSMAHAQKDLGDVDARIKKAGDEPLAVAPLVEEKKLIESRMLRTKERLKALGALPADGAPKAGH